ncbi:MAG: hypothetical protein MUC44_08140 [Beijerinckiaceae bacterium]|nr:hypothetical protein [Beijerinckiaceae bacterium]
MAMFLCIVPLHCAVAGGVAIEPVADKEDTRAFRSSRCLFRAKSHPEFRITIQHAENSGKPAKKDDSHQKFM